MTIKFAQRLFLVAGIYGILVIPPLFFLEQQLGEHFPPPINHPEIYYGFACVTLGWQIAYLLMSRDPLRFRPMIIPAIIGKAGFVLSVFVLFMQQRVDAAYVGLAAPDLGLAILFAWAFVALGGQTEAG